MTARRELTHQGVTLPEPLPGETLTRRIVRHVQAAAAARRAGVTQAQYTADMWRIADSLTPRDAFAAGMACAAQRADEIERHTITGHDGSFLAAFLETVAQHG